MALWKSGRHGGIWKEAWSKAAKELYIIEKDEIKSPLGVLYYTYYHEIDEVEQFVTHNHNQIQFVVSDSSCPISHMSFGTAQHPDLWDFADQIDTLHFLLTSTYDEEA